MEMEWEEPPSYAKRPGAGGSPGRYVKFAFELQQHPGRWALLPASSTSDKGAEATAHNILKGKVKGFAVDKSVGEFETAVDGKKIYVRYIEKSAERKRPADDVEEPSRGEIRAWAKQQGIHVADRGQIPQEVVDKYKAAHA